MARNILTYSESVAALTTSGTLITVAADELLIIDWIDFSTMAEFSIYHSDGAQTGANTMLRGEPLGAGAAGFRDYRSPARGGGFQCEKGEDLKFAKDGANKLSVTIGYHILKGAAL
jgi:hypothetical protein